MGAERKGCLASIFPGLFKPTEPADDDDFPYGLRDDFLSRNEAAFYHALREAAADRLVICPKVRLADVLFVRRPHENRAAWPRISQKHLDFVLCEPGSMRPVAAIELDDSTHDRPDRVERDDFVDGACAAADLPLERIRARSSYPVSDVLGIVARYASGGIAATPTPTLSAATETDGEAPQCPKCGVRMVKREARRGVNAGQKFFGCPNYPACREIIPIE